MRLPEKEGEVKMQQGFRLHGGSTHQARSRALAQLVRALPSLGEVTGSSPVCLKEELDMGYDKIGVQLKVISL
jgi:hypothetical protein